MDRAQLLTQMLLKQGYVALRLKSSLQSFYCGHHNLVDRYEVYRFPIILSYSLFTQTFVYIDIVLYATWSLAIGHMIKWKIYWVLSFLLFNKSLILLNNGKMLQDMK
jgi:hypothetical protein